MVKYGRRVLKVEDYRKDVCLLPKGLISVDGVEKVYERRALQTSLLYSTVLRSLARISRKPVMLQTLVLNNI